MKASPRWLGGLTRGTASAKEILGRSYDFVTPTADSWLLIDRAKQVVDDMRG